MAQTLRVAPSGRLVVIDRWTQLTRPLASGEAPPLALDQLAAVRRPVEAAPVDLFSELADGHLAPRLSVSMRVPRQDSTTGTGGTGRWPPGPTVVFDLDGVLSDAASRQHYLEGPWRDWDAFFEACGDDPLIEEVGPAAGVARPEPGDRPAYRPSGRVQPQTLAWLHRYGLRWDLLVMRDLRRLRGGPGVQAAFGAGAAGRRIRTGPVLRGRPPQRRHVPRRGHPVASTSTPATTTERSVTRPGIGRKSCSWPFLS